MFKGRFQYVEVDILPAESVAVRALDQKLACDPKTQIGVIVDLDNGIDRILIVGDDAYTMGRHPIVGAPKWTRHAWYGTEGFGVYWIKKKPAGTAEMIMQMLNAKER